MSNVIHSLRREGRRYGVNEYTAESLAIPTLFEQNNASFNGWTTSGAVSIDNTIGSPVPSFSIPQGGYAYTNANIVSPCTITLQMYANAGTSLCNIFFMCNASGVGTMYRLECRSAASGFGTTSGWATRNPAGNMAQQTAAAWHSLRFQINASNGVTGYIDGVLMSQSIVAGAMGPYIGCDGDGGNGGHFQDIKVYNGLI